MTAPPASPGPAKGRAPGSGPSGPERALGLATRIARDLSGASFVATATPVVAGEWPVAAVAIGETLLVLVRDHHSTFSISLPHDHSWSLRSVDEWSKHALAVGAALASYRTEHAHVTTLADAVVELRAILGAEWDVNIPGVTVPTETWLRRGDASVGLFQQKTTIEVVVWVGDSMRSQRCGSRAELAALGPWLGVQLEAQREKLAAEAAEVARRRALPVPTLDEVMFAMRRGVEFSTGGGRAYSTYRMDGDVIKCRSFDEGDTYEDTIDNAELLKAIERHPDVFRRER